MDPGRWILHEINPVPNRLATLLVSYFWEKFLSSSEEVQRQVYNTIREAHATMVGAACPICS
jgi:hypothetical protein